MKTIAIAAIALACVFALTMAQYPGFGAQQQSGLGSGGLLALIGGLFLIMFLFNGNSSTGSGSSTIIYGNFSGPTGGK